MGWNTRAVQGDRTGSDGSPVSPPIYQTSTWTTRDADHFASVANRPRESRCYTRHGNPNHEQVATAIAGLEGAEAGMVFASGMGTITSTVLALLEHGDHVVVQRSMYGGTTSLAQTLLPRLGIRATVVEQSRPEEFAGAVRPDTRLVLVETPSNPLLQITDLAAVSEIAHEAGAVVVADNTFATPVNSRPIEFGVDLVWHSATKYLGGHSDLSAGALAGSAELVDRIWETSIITGAVLGPIDAWLLLRGLRTLPLRIAQHNANGLRVAAALTEHPAVSVVHYPGLDTHPGHHLAAAQMDGFGGVMSFELSGGYAAADRFIDRLTIPVRSASLGSVESLVVHPAAMWASILAPDQLAATGVRPGLVRLSLGIEDSDDLVADVVAALG
jgi:methionine-gamma-lyase